MHRACLLVALTWTVLPAFAAMPLMIGIPGMSFTDAYFETASAMTTTGATVLVGLDSLLVGAMTAMLLVLTLVPEIVLFLPRWLGYL